MGPTTVPGQVRSLVKALAILDCFTADQPELGVSELARQLHMPTSTVGRLLTTLHKAGVLTQDATTQRYRMGSRVLLWSSVYMNGLDLRTKARPMLEELHRLTRETVNLYALDGLERLCVDRIESTQRLRVIVQVGEHMPLYAGSAGKAILAYAPPALVQRVLERPLERMTENTITDRDRLLEELRVIRGRGYATSHSERFTDVLGVAAPIFDATGTVIGSLNMAGPLVRLGDADVARYAPEVMRLAGQVSRALAYLGPYPPPQRRER